MLTAKEYIKKNYRLELDESGLSDSCDYTWDLMFGIMEDYAKYRESGGKD